MIKSLQSDLNDIKAKISAAIGSADVYGIKDASIQLRLAHTHLCSAMNHCEHEGELRYGGMVK
jgi:hypothetical protein